MIDGEKITPEELARERRALQAQLERQQQQSLLLPMIDLASNTQAADRQMFAGDEGSPPQDSAQPSNPD